MPAHVYLLLAGLVCAGTRVSACACPCTQSMTSSQVRSSARSARSARADRSFPRIKSPALLSRLISLPPAAPMISAFRGPRGSQSTASGGGPAVQSPSNRGCQMRPGGSARQLSRARTFHCNLCPGSCPPTNHMHRLFPSLSKPALQLQLRPPSGTTSVLPLSYFASLGGRPD